MKQKLIIGIVIVLLITVIYFDFRTRANAFPPVTDIKDVIITLQRGGCYGVCPIYRLTIYGNGSVVYDGERFVKTTGTKTIAIGEEKISQLIAEFEKINYFSLDESYERYMATDMQTVVTSITVNEKIKSIRHYYGDTSAPEGLAFLETKIDEITNSTQWTEHIPRGYSAYEQNPVYCEKDSDCVPFGAVGGSACSCGCEAGYGNVIAASKRQQQYETETCMRYCDLSKACKLGCINNSCEIIGTLLGGQG